MRLRYTKRHAESKHGLNVLLLSEHFPPRVGGTSTYTLNVTREISLVSGRCHLVTFGKTMHTSRVTPPKAVLHLLDPPEVFKKERFFPLVAFFTCLRILRVETVDVIHALQGFFAFSLGAFLGKLFQVPVVWTVQNLPPAEIRIPKPFRSRLLNQSFASFYEKANVDFAMLLLRAPHARLVCVSEETALKAENLGANRDIIRIVPNGVNLDVFSPSSESKPLGENRPELVNAAGFIRHKGQDVLLHAMVRVLKASHDAHITFIGPEREEGWKEGLKRLATDLQINDHVTLLSPLGQKALADRYRSCAVYVHPSREEGFAMAVFEAMSCGCPVVVTDTADLQKLVEATGGGIAVPIDDPEALAEAIVRLLSNPEEATKMGLRNARFVSEHYSWKIIAEQLLGVYQEAVSDISPQG